MGISTAFILTLLCYIVTAVNEVPGAVTVAPLTDPTTTVAPRTDPTTTIAPLTNPTTTSKPLLKFSCVNGKVHDISGPDLKMESIVIYKGNGTMCHNTANGCIWKDLSKTLHVRYDEDETNTNVVAGRHPKYFELECKAGYVASASATVLDINPQTPSYTHQVIKGTAGPHNGITITLYKKSTPATPLAVPVDIGEELILKITGPVHTIGIPITCTASADSNSVSLWDSANCKSKDKVIMEDNWTADSNTISIKMYAFRFVDSASVTIACSAYVCPMSNTDCKTEVKNCLSQNLNNVGRRRRNSDIVTKHLNKYREKSSSVSFTVVDRYGGANGSGGVSGNTVLYLTAGLITMCLLRGE